MNNIKYIIGCFFKSEEKLTEIMTFDKDGCLGRPWYIHLIFDIREIWIPTFFYLIIFAIVLRMVIY